MNNPITDWFRLEPADAWFFRNGKPFNRGEDQSDLESLFPPHPSTVVGALRAALAREQGWNGQGKWDPKLNAMLGDGFDDLGQLGFVGPLLEKEGELLFPMPLHVLGKTDEGEDKKTFVACDWLVPSEKPIASDMGAVHLPLPMGMHRTGRGEKAPSSADGFFVTATGMQKILDGELPSQDDSIHRDELFCIEARVGIERTVETRTAREGAIYSPRYIRLRRSVRLVVGISGLPEGWKLPRFFPLGGESRLAACDKIDPPAFPELPNEIGPAVLVLATPACFANGVWWGAAPGEDAGKLAADIGGTVQTAAFDRPIDIGGWDSVNHHPLALQPYVRPGAVWWLSAEAKVAADETRFHRIGGRNAYGYGLAFSGKQPSLKTT